jgi:hypothetical protein
VFVGREIGSVPSGLKVGKRLGELPERNPIRTGYELWFGRVAKDRHVADPTTVLYAVRGLGERWGIEEKGYMDLREDMTFEWRDDRDSGQGYLLKRAGMDRVVEKEIEGLMMKGPGVKKAQ